MITWTTYGTWLQGDKRGYVKDGKILPLDKGLEEANKKLQKCSPVRLSSKQKKDVENAIIKEAKRIGQKILALAVCSNHVHLVTVPCNESIESSVSRYKNVSTFALKKTVSTNRIWTRGFDKRFCFNNEELQEKVRYVCRHLQDNFRYYNNG